MHCSEALNDIGSFTTNADTYFQKNQNNQTNVTSFMILSSLCSCILLCMMKNTQTKMTEHIAIFHDKLLFKIEFLMECYNQNTTKIF